MQALTRKLDERDSLLARQDPARLRPPCNLESEDEEAEDLADRGADAASGRHAATGRPDGGPLVPTPKPSSSDSSSGAPPPPPPPSPSPVLVSVDAVSVPAETTSASAAPSGPAPASSGGDDPSAKGANEAAGETAARQGAQSEAPNTLAPPHPRFNLDSNESRVETSDRHETRDKARTAAETVVGATALGEDIWHVYVRRRGVNRDTPTRQGLRMVTAVHSTLKDVRGARSARDWILALQDAAAVADAQRKHRLEIIRNDAEIAKLREGRRRGGGSSGEEEDDDSDDDAMFEMRPAEPSAAAHVYTGLAAEDEDEEDDYLYVFPREGHPSDVEDMYTDEEFTDTEQDADVTAMSRRADSEDISDSEGDDTDGERSGGSPTGTGRSPSIIDTRFERQTASARLLITGEAAKQYAAPSKPPQSGPLMLSPAKTLIQRKFEAVLLSAVAAELDVMRGEWRMDESKRVAALRRAAKEWKKPEAVKYRKLHNLAASDLPPECAEYIAGLRADVEHFTAQLQRSAQAVAETECDVDKARRMTRRALSFTLDQQMTAVLVAEAVVANEPPQVPPGPMSASEALHADGNLNSIQDGAVVASWRVPKRAPVRRRSGPSLEQNASAKRRRVTARTATTGTSADVDMTGLDKAEGDGRLNENEYDLDDDFIDDDDVEHDANGLVDSANGGRSSRQSHVNLGKLGTDKSDRDEAEAGGESDSLKESGCALMPDKMEDVAGWLKPGGVQLEVRVESGLWVPAITVTAQVPPRCWSTPRITPAVIAALGTARCNWWVQDDLPEGLSRIVGSTRICNTVVEAFGGPVGSFSRNTTSAEPPLKDDTAVLLLLQGRPGESNGGMREREERGSYVAVCQNGRAWVEYVSPTSKANPVIYELRKTTQNKTACTAQEMKIAMKKISANVDMSVWKSMDKASSTALKHGTDMGLARRARIKAFIRCAARRPFCDFSKRTLKSLDDRTHKYARRQTLVHSSFVKNNEDGVNHSRARGGGGSARPGAGNGGSGRQGNRSNRRMMGFAAGAAAATAAVELGQRPDDVALFDENDGEDDTPADAAFARGAKGDAEWGKPMVEGTLASALKEHQWDGVRFLWRHVVEGFERQQRIERGASGSPATESNNFSDDQEGLPGCILAHSMGLGKTLQTVTFLHTLSTRQPPPGGAIRNTVVNVHHTRALLVVPANVLGSWGAEFSRWLPRVRTGDTPVGLTLESVYILGLSDEPIEREARDASRMEKLNAWGASLHGVLLITFELFAKYVCPPPAGARRAGRPPNTAAAKDVGVASGVGITATAAAPEATAHGASVVEAAAVKLLTEGAAVVVVDEAHEIRNEKSIQARALSRIHTTRRIALTGYPLQNNIDEYFSMINFVAPDMLGDRKSFTNRFGKIITRGLGYNATSAEKTAMRKKLSALKDIVGEIMFRIGPERLAADLPCKHDSVLRLSLTPLQMKLQLAVTQELEEQANFLAFVHLLDQIYNQPYQLLAKLRAEEAREAEEAQDSDEVKGETNATTVNAVTANIGAETNEDVVGTMTGDSGDGEGVNSDAMEVTRFTEDDVIHISDSEESSFSEAVNEVTTSALDPFMTKKKSTTPRSLRRVLLKIFSDFGFPTEEPCATSAPTSHVTTSKMEFLSSIVDHCVEQGEKLLVFSQRIGTLDEIECMLTLRGIGYDRIDGGTGKAERQKTVNRFQATRACFNPSQVGTQGKTVFLISTRAGSLGITLTAARYVVVLEPGWNPCHNAQAIHRAYRYGQEREVFCYRLLYTGSFEERLFDTASSKEGITQWVVEGRTTKMRKKRRSAGNVREGGRGDDVLGRRVLPDPCPRDINLISRFAKASSDAFLRTFIAKDASNNAGILHAISDHTEDVLSEDQALRLTDEERIAAAEEELKGRAFEDLSMAEQRIWRKKNGRALRNKERRILLQAAKSAGTSLLATDRDPVPVPEPTNSGGIPVSADDGAPTADELKILEDLVERASTALVPPHSNTTQALSKATVAAMRSAVSLAQAASEKGQRHVFSDVRYRAALLAIFCLITAGENKTVQGAAKKAVDQMEAAASAAGVDLPSAAILLAQAEFRNVGAQADMEKGQVETRQVTFPPVPCVGDEEVVEPPLPLGNGPVSRFQGVSWETSMAQWRMQIRHGEHHRVSCHVTEQDAARAYDDALVAIGLSRVNFPGDNIPTSGPRFTATPQQQQQQQYMLPPQPMQPARLPPPHPRQQGWGGVGGPPPPMHNPVPIFVHAGVTGGGGYGGGGPSSGGGWGSGPYPNAPPQYPHGGMGSGMDGPPGVAPGMHGGMQYVYGAPQGPQHKVGLLVHGSSCRVAKCRVLNCTKVKLLLKHAATCKIYRSEQPFIKTQCQICQKAWMIFQAHSTGCKTANCPVPHCRELKDRAAEQQEERGRAAGRAIGAPPPHQAVMEKGQAETQFTLPSVLCKGGLDAGVTGGGGYGGGGPSSGGGCESGPDPNAPPQYPHGGMGSGMGGPPGGAAGIARRHGGMPPPSYQQRFKFPEGQDGAGKTSAGTSVADGVVVAKPAGGAQANLNSNMRGDGDGEITGVAGVARLSSDVRPVQPATNNHDKTQQQQRQDAAEVNAVESPGPAETVACEVVFIDD